MKNQPAFYSPMELGLPQALDAERFLLGSVMLDGEKMNTVRDLLSQEDFAIEKHRRIWGRVCEMHDAGQVVDRTTVMFKLQATGELESVDGISYLCSLDEGLPIVANLESYISQIRVKSVKRRAIIKCNDLMLRLSRTDEDAAEVFFEAEELMGKFSGELVNESEFSTPFQIIERAGGIDRYLSARRVEGVTSPWGQLNRMTGGFRPGNLILLAAQTGRGKTAMALNIAHHAAVSGFAPAIFSMEMDRSEINDRLISISGRIDGRTLRRQERDPNVEVERRKQVGAAARELTMLPVYISDKSRSTIPAMHAELRRLMAKQKVGLVIVDYLQLAQGVGRFDKRADEVASIARGLKRMAMELKIPVLALSQFNRDSSKDNREPELHDLKESSELEQAANLVLMIHFTRMYDVSAGIETGEVKLKVAKQRAGPVGFINLMFHAPSGVFYESSNETER